MNRKNLTSAVLAGLTGVAGIAASAQAVNINPDGLGQVLLYPYYTTNGGNDTLLSVVNTTDNAKAVKVRFTEGMNTREVLDFNLYLSPWDVWTAALYDDEGTPTFVTGDTSCTVPYLYLSGPQPFLPYALTDGGPTDISRASEGHFEMIEMGTLVDREHTSASDATHDDTGVPANCGNLIDAWTDPDNTVVGDEGYWLQNPLDDIDPPSGGLFGGAAVVNVTKGFMVSYDAKAINGFATVADPNGEPLHAVPGTVLPSLNSGDVLDATVFLEDGTTLASSGLTRGVDAVSFVFMHDQIMNEYITDAGVQGNTEWVLTFPTKHFYVYAPSAAPLVPPVAPFTTEWVDAEAMGPDGWPCEVVILEGIWDREEATPGREPGQPIPPIVSPAPPNPDAEPIIPFELCFETSVIAFGDPTDMVEAGVTPVLGSANFHNINNEELGFASGWVRLEMDDYPHDANGDGSVDAAEALLSRDTLGGLEGLPVMGFSAQQYGNASLGEGGDVLANYGGIFQHKGTRKVASS